MQELEPLALLQALLPGLLAAAIFHALTSHPRLSPFERIVHALILTLVVQTLLICVRVALHAAGRIVQLGVWSEGEEQIWPVILAVPVGVAFAWAANTDKIHGALRRARITRQSSFPSEWIGGFSRRPVWVVLHLDGGRRLFGYPHAWPDEPDGHLVIEHAAWLLDDGGRQALPEGGALMIRSKDVEMVEFVSTPAAQQNVGVTDGKAAAGPAIPEALCECEPRAAAEARATSPASSEKEMNP